MSAYSALLDKTVTAIVAQFDHKNAASLFTGRGGKLMDAARTVKSSRDFELITWLLIMYILFHICFKGFAMSATAKVFSTGKLH